MNQLTNFFRASVLSEPLAVLPAYAEMLGEIHERARIAAETVNWAGMKFDVQGVERIGRAAVIPVCGPFVGFESPDPRIFGATSIGVVGKMFQEAMQSDAETIVFKFDSPGGVAGGIFDLGLDIFDARKGTKNIIGFVNGTCASAAYHLAAQCEQLFAAPSSMLGSIGVIGKFYSMDRWEKNIGIDCTTVASHELKSTGTGPLTPNQLTYLKDLLDSVSAQFNAAVTRGRPQVNIAEAATGRVWIAQDPRGVSDAVTLGLCDGVKTLSRFVTEL